MRMLDLAFNDLRQVLRDRKTAIFLLIMPLAFTVLFGFAFGGFDVGEADDPRLPVGLLDQDSSALSRQLVDLLTGSAVMRVEETATTAQELSDQVGDNTLAAAVVVPAGYGAGLAQGQPAAITLIADSASSAGATVQTEVAAAARRFAAAANTARISVQALAAGQPQAAQAGDPAARQAAFDRALAAALAAWQQPPVSIRATQTAAPREKTLADSSNAFAHSSPGMMVQFAVAGLITAAAVLVAERQSRCLQRLLTTDISRPEILAGHFLAMFLLIFGQLLLLALFGQLFLRLNYLGAPIAALAVVTATALFAASLGLLIGTLARSQEQVIVFSLLPMFVLSGFGGAWMPLEFTPESFQRIARLTPLAWAMAGFQDIVVRGQGLPAVLPAVAALLAYAVALAGLAVWRFRTE